MLIWKFRKLAHLKMTSEGSKRRDFLALVFISKLIALLQKKECILVIKQIGLQLRGRPISLISRNLTPLSPITIIDCNYDDFLSPAPYEYIDRFTFKKGCQIAKANGKEE